MWTKRPLLVAVLLALAGLARAETVQVSQLAGNLFQPRNLVVRVGDTVTWLNDDTRPHTTTSGVNGTWDGLFDSANMAPGDTFSYTFTSPGDYDYYCDYHLPEMVGRVTVLEQAVVVRQLDRTFEPRDLIIRTGETVIWRNDSSRPHTTTSGRDGSPDGLFDSGNMDGGDTFVYTFTSAGGYDYYCDYHLPEMVGTVTVLDQAQVVVQRDRVFEPAFVSVPEGTTVIWRNESTRPHTTTSGSGGNPDGLFDSGNMAGGDFFAYTFGSEGLYDYYCDYHLPEMVGQVEVTAATPGGLVVRLAKQGADVVLSWEGGSAPYEVLRGQSSDLSDLSVISNVASGTGDTDAGAVWDSLQYYYQVR